MSGGELTSFRSILDKPLHLLTEDDISQVTREDCRKYLKDKGMRKPSWNKSQAIQQVISLKALLEPTEDFGTGALPLKRILVTQNSSDSLIETSCGGGAGSGGAGGGGGGGAGCCADIADEAAVEHARMDAYKAAPPLDSEVDTKAVTPRLRSPGARNASDGQMTIFYCGKVNVYDGVPPNKARAIMHIAASTDHLPEDSLFCGTAAVLSSQCPLQTTSDKHCVNPMIGVSQTVQTDKMMDYTQQCREKSYIMQDSDSQASRKVSLQRYLDKKKDRVRFKGRKSVALNSSGLEVYLNQQAKTHNLNGQSSRSSTNSPPQPVPPNSHYSLNDKKTNASFSVDLNEDVQEH